MNEMLTHWIWLYSKTPSLEGGVIAEHVVGQLNEAIARNTLFITPEPTWSTDWQAAVAALPVQPASLLLPWQAYHLSLISSQGGNVERLKIVDSVNAILATVPLEYQTTNYQSEYFSSSRSETLLHYIAKLILNAKQHLYILAPYWSLKGIRHLQRTLGNITTFAPQVTVITPANLKPEDIEGCEAFKKWLESRGASVKHLVPKKLSDNTRPFMHAKLILSDHSECYIGSANFSDNGLHRSIEFGIGLQGEVVTQIGKWLESLMENFETN